MGRGGAFEKGRAVTLYRVYYDEQGCEIIEASSEAEAIDILLKDYPKAKNVIAEPLRVQGIGHAAP